MHKENTYITLTYRNEALPWGGSLHKKDFTNFIKRFRKAIQPKKIRYYMCGEYGEQCLLCYQNKENCSRSSCRGWNPGLGRAHFHSIIFGHEFRDKQKFKTNKQGDALYTSRELDKYWGWGHATIGDVTFESCAYVARYIAKKITGDKALDHYYCFDNISGLYIQRSPEYTTMSRRPGIAANWYQKFKSDLDKDYITMRGVKMRPPKYYDKQREKEDPFGYDDIIEKRSDKARTLDQKDNTKERLKVREYITNKKTKSLTRGL